MPFPLAHPAAVLPFRRWCPRRLDFAALVIGSVTPDTGYLFSRYHAAAWSHSFWTGGVGYCLPVGLLLFWVFHVLRSSMAGRLPVRCRDKLGPLCRRPAPGLPVLLASLLIGAWTHILLDSFTHRDGWVVERVGFLRAPLYWLNSRNGEVCDLLYYGLTFAGVAWLMVCLLRWLDGQRGASPTTVPRLRWMFAALLAVAVLALCAACRHWRLI